MRAIQLLSLRSTGKPAVQHNHGDIVSNPLQTQTGPHHEYLNSSIEEDKKALLKELKKSKDPRIAGPENEIFYSYLSYSQMQEFPDPRIKN